MNNSDRVWVIFQHGAVEQWSRNHADVEMKHYPERFYTPNAFESEAEARKMARNRARQRLDDAQEIVNTHTQRLVELGEEWPLVSQKGHTDNA